MPDEKDDKSQAGKGVDDKSIKTPEPKGEAITQQRLDAEVARRHKAEEELEKHRKGMEESKTKALEEQNKFKELYEGTKAKAAEAEELGKSLSFYYAQETEGLTDEQKALIPDAPVHKQLEWVAKARKAGVFGKPTGTDKTFNGKMRNVPPEKWYVDIDSKDARFNTLTPAQYQEWKAHNKQQRSVGSLTGRGGF